jgi:hypothetical protein
MVQSFGQPKFSRDSIAEFEFVANRKASSVRQSHPDANSRLRFPRRADSPATYP